MSPRTRLMTAALFLVCGATLVLDSAPAEGDPKADEALEKAVAEGKKLWSKSWKKGAKSCRACHTRGPNKLTAERLKEYPKYDKVFRRVVTGQQKLNQMIKSKSKGEQLELGSEELNALEAYISTLK